MRPVAPPMAFGAEGGSTVPIPARSRASRPSTAIPMPAAAIATDAPPSAMSSLRCFSYGRPPYPVSPFRAVMPKPRVPNAKMKAVGDAVGVKQSEAAPCAARLRDWVKACR